MTTLLIKARAWFLVGTGDDHPLDTLRPFFVRSYVRCSDQNCVCATGLFPVPQNNLMRYLKSLLDTVHSTKLCVSDAC